MIRSPIKLEGEAAKFWKRHAPRLRAARILTDADLDSLAVLCLTWSKLVTICATAPGADSFREMVQMNALLKQFQQYAREFGLTPAARKRLKLGAIEAPKVDEYGL